MSSNSIWLSILPLPIRMDDSRPNPDALLKALQRTEASGKKGKLSIFFGMAAGAGKTYAMLQAAQSRLKEGVDVVIGLIETHGRSETEALTVGLPSIPRKKILYKDKYLLEFDIDAVLARKPSLVLIDELAHTNVPGSRHEKRWQDVLEILDSGIDVYSTLNVQHIESRIEDIEAITGITIRETVPDSVLERADHIEVIDITPEDLLKRLKEGKVYIGDLAERAAQNFFKDDRLTAMREMALRFTAEKVDNDLRILLTLRGRMSGWRSTERIMVAISHSPTSENLIRTTRRIAFSLDAPWIAVYVDTGAILSDKDRIQLEKNLKLVNELGGENVSTAGPDIAVALKRLAEREGITQIVFGRPVRNRIRALFSGGTPLEKLVSESGSFDVLILRQESQQKSKRRLWSIAAPQSGFLPYWYLLWVIGAVSLFNSLINPIIGYKAVGFIFMLSILVISLFVSLGPILFSAILSTFIWDFFFIPPRFTFYIRAPEDIIMGIAYFVVAVVTGSLTHRIRWREKMLQQREEQTHALYEIVKAIASEPNKEKFIANAMNQLGFLLNARCFVLLGDQYGELYSADGGKGHSELGEQEMAVAKYSFANNKLAGWSTDTLASADSMYLPLVGTENIVGVLVFRPKKKIKLLPEESNFLHTVSRQLAIGIEREISSEKSRHASQLQESERLHQTILDSVSHEIRTPLTTIIGISSALQEIDILQNADSRNELTGELISASERLNLVVENLLDTSRLNSGILKLKLEWCDPKDLISVSLRNLGKLLESHTLTVIVPDKLPLIYVDFHLIEQVLSNLVRNAVFASEHGKEIKIAFEVAGDFFNIIVSDAGPGIPDGETATIFERFYRVKGARSGGMGLGLWLAKNIVELHAGKIEAGNRPGGGAVFTVSLPIKSQPQIPLED